MRKAVQTDYMFSSGVKAASTTLFASLTDVEKIRQWWENPVEGSALEGGELIFKFSDSDDSMLVSVDIAQEPHTVQWTVKKDSSYDGEWVGTKIFFEIATIGSESSVLAFTHYGLSPEKKSYEACAQGWDRFLQNIIELSEASAKITDVSTS